MDRRNTKPSGSISGPSWSTHHRRKLDLIWLEKPAGIPVFRPQRPRRRLPLARLLNARPEHEADFPGIRGICTVSMFRPPGVLARAFPALFTGRRWKISLQSHRRWMAQNTIDKALAHKIKEEVVVHVFAAPWEVVPNTTLRHIEVRTQKRSSKQASYQIRAPPLLPVTSMAIESVDACPPPSRVDSAAAGRLRNAPSLSSPPSPVTLAKSPPPQDRGCTPVAAVNADDPPHRRC